MIILHYVPVVVVSVPALRIHMRLPHTTILLHMRRRFHPRLGGWHPYSEAARGAGGGGGGELVAVSGRLEELLHLR